MRHQLIKHIRTTAFEQGDFTLASGKKSTYYINIKKVYTDTEALNMISALILQELVKHQYDYKLAGIELGGVPIVAATALAFETNTSYLIVRKETKEHGVENLGIEGTFTKGERVILLEDVTTTGMSAVNAVIKLRGAGLICNTVISVVDRKDDAWLSLNRNNITLIPIITVDELMEKEEVSI